MFHCYRQLEHSDCGLTCIRMVARHYGKRIPMAFLKKSSDLNRLGMSIGDMTSCLAAIGMESMAVKISATEAANMPLPAILFWSQKHFVVLYHVNRRGTRFHIADPALGKLTYSRDEFERLWIPNADEKGKGLVVLAEPGENFNERQYETYNTLCRLFRYIVKIIRLHKSCFFWVLMISLLVMAADLSVPLLLRSTVDKGIGLRDMGLVMTLLLSQLAMVAGSLVSSNIINILLTRLGLNIDLGMTKDFLARLVRFPLSFFDQRVSSDFIQKVSDQGAIKSFLMSFPNTLLMTGLSLAVFSALLWHYSPLIFGVFVFLSLAEMAWGMLFLGRRKSLNFAVFSDSSENRNNIYEMLNGMSEIKVNNAEGTRLRQWQTTQERLNRTSLRSAWIDLFDSGGQSMVGAVKNIVVTGISAAMVIDGSMTMGIMMTLSYITGRLAQPFRTISSTVLSVQSAALSYERIDEVMSQNLRTDGDVKYNIPSISLENVSFRYPGKGSPMVIRNLSLNVNPGEVVALVGESGCGKTTLIKLMLGFYWPQEGNIMLSGIPLAEIDRDDWLRHCGVVMQTGSIFTGSILENIALSDESPNASRAMEMLEIVGLKTFVETLPMGIDTTIGVAGIEMSGGQKQRLMIARALYKDPDILFLDEATSSLDANNERNITENIRLLGQGKTIIIAAHRLSTVKNADKIVFIKEGEISEFGTHDELVALGKDYRRLVKNQLDLST